MELWTEQMGPVHKPYILAEKRTNKVNKIYVIHAIFKIYVLSS